MALKFLGHAPSFQIWVFELDGKQFVARNFSTQNPLMIKFVGNYPDTYSGSAGLIKTSGFDIISGTSQPSTGGIAGVVEWVWLGNRYRNTYYFNLGDIGEDEESTLQFAAPIPYNGAAGGPVGGGGATKVEPPTAPFTTAVDETLEALKNANKQLEISESQRKVDVRALNEARAELDNAKQMLRVTEERATAANAAVLAQLREQVQIAQDRADVQVQTLQRALAEGQTALAETAGSLEAAKQSLAVSEAQGRVNLEALNNARVELENVKATMAVAEVRLSQTQAAALARMREEIEAAQSRADAQIAAMRAALAAQQQQQTPPVTTPPVTPPVTSPVFTPPKATPGVEVAPPSGTDWVKLGLQLGAAYLLLS